MHNSKFDKVYHFDSSIGDTLNIQINKPVHWTLVVTDLQFKLPAEGEIDDMTAYLHIKTKNFLMSKSCITQTGRKVDGLLLPISKPGTDNKISVPAKGTLETPDNIEFAILDKDLNPISVERLVVTFRMFEQCENVLLL